MKILKKAHIAIGKPNYKTEGSYWCEIFIIDVPVSRMQFSHFEKAVAKSSCCFET
jgi:hypothetical protein